MINEIIISVLRRFQKKTISPPRSVVCSSSITTTNTTTNNSSKTSNVTTSPPNERKRTAPEAIVKDVPPPKRVSAPSSSSSSSVRDKNLEKQADKFTAKGAQQKNSSSTTTVPHQSVLPSSVRPRFTPQPIVAPSSQPPSSIKTTTTTPRSRQLPSVVIKRPLVPVTAPSQTSTKRIEHVSSSSNAATSSSKSTVERQTPSITNEEDENQLLKLNETTDVVDTFALIDEALLEADQFLELM